MAFDPRLRSPKERPLFLIGAIFSGLVWAALVVSLVGALYGLAILAAVLIAHALFLAHIKGNGLRVSEHQLPELYERCKAASRKLGLEDVPEIYILQSGGMLNAFATKLLSRKFVILLSDLADGCRDERQLDFVVGHELGHLAAGHLGWRGFLAPARLLPWVGPAYSRACEYTSDRCGLEVAGDLEQSKRALLVLAAGGRQAARANLEAFMDQRRQAGGFWMAIYELVSSHPYLCKRVAALEALSSPTSVRPVSRNPFAYLLAPFLGASAGGGSAMMALLVVWVGMGAAVAVPAYLKFQRQLSAAPAQGATDVPDHQPLDAADLDRQLGVREKEEELRQDVLDELERRPAKKTFKSRVDAPAQPKPAKRYSYEGTRGLSP